MAQVVSARFHSSLQAREAIYNLLGSRFPPERVTTQSAPVWRPEARARLRDGGNTARWGAGMGASLCGAIGGLGSLVSLSLPGGAGIGHPLLVLAAGACFGALWGGLIGGALGMVLEASRRTEEEDRPLDSDIVVATIVLSAIEARRAERALLMHVSPFTRQTLETSEITGRAPL